MYLNLIVTEINKNCYYTGNYLFFQYVLKTISLVSCLHPQTVPNYEISIQTPKLYIIFGFFGKLYLGIAHRNYFGQEGFVKTPVEKSGRK